MSIKDKIKKVRDNVYEVPGSVNKNEGFWKIVS